MKLHFDIYLTALAKPIFFLAGTIPVVHLYQSQERSVTGPSGADLSAGWLQPDGHCVLVMCFVCQSDAVRETKSDWMAHSVFAADALTCASIIAPPTGRGGKMQHLQKKALLWSRAPDRNSCNEWGLGAQTSVVTKARNIALDILLGFCDWSKNVWHACVCVYVCLCLYSKFKSGCHLCVMEC